MFPTPVAITGLAMRSCLGATPGDHRAAILAGRHGLRPLGEFLGAASPHAPLLGGWLRDRACLAGRRYGAASNLAVAVAREAVAHAGLSKSQLASAWIFAGTSRGNAFELLGQHHGRRPMKKLAASNSMHSEIAAAVSIDLGIRGGWQVLSNGCSSGLDALGLASLAVAAGAAPRALVVSVDLPLAPRLLDDFAATGLLSKNGRNDPYAADTGGFFPAEAGAALVIEPVGQASAPPLALVHGYCTNADAYDLLCSPPDGGTLAELICGGLAGREHSRLAICPHATGTSAYGLAERQGLLAAFAAVPAPVSVHLMKPFTGHSLGASGALDVAILATFLLAEQLPPNLPGLAGAGGPLLLPSEPLSAKETAVLKLSVGMGGHNALVVLSAA